MSSLLSPLAQRDFAQLFAAQVGALIGTGLTTIALALLAHELGAGDASVILGTVLATKMVAYVFVAPVAAARLRNLPRNRVLVALDLVRAAAVCCLPFVTEIWQIFAAIFVLNTAAAAFKPLFQATVADVVSDEERYTQALSLTRVAYDLENLLSPALGAALLIFVSYDALFAANGVCFVVSAVLVGTAALSVSAKADVNIPVLQRALTGFGRYMKTPRLRALLCLHVGVASTGAMAIVNTVTLVRRDMQGTETEMAMAMAAMGAGSMIAAMGLPRLLSATNEATIMRAGIWLASGGLLAGVVLPINYPTLVALWFCVGLGTSATQTPGGRLLRRSGHARDRAQLFAAHFSLSHLCWLGTYPLAGWLYAWSPKWAFGGLGLLAAAAALVSSFVWRRRDELPIEHVHPATVHSHDHGHDDGHHEHVHDHSHDQHSHEHRHEELRHTHEIVLDDHHHTWPAGHVKLPKLSEQAS